MLKFSEIPITLNTFIYNNIASDTLQVGYDGVDFTPIKNQFVRVKHINTVTEREALTGTDVGIEVTGFTRFQIYDKDGVGSDNAVATSQIAETITGLYFNKTFNGTNITIRTHGTPQLENIGQSEEFQGYYLGLLAIPYVATVGI